MQSRPSVALVAGVAALAVVLPACGSDEPSAAPAQSVATETSPSGDVPTEAGPPTEGESGCVPPDDDHERICGLAPSRRRLHGGTAYKVTTISGEGFWVILPDELAPSSGVVAVPGVPIRAKSHLTTASARDAADRYCDGFRECEPAVVEREVVSGGVLTRWDDASGTIRDLGVTTLDFGRWTLVISEQDANPAERVARGLTWSVGEDGYPRLASTDPEVPVDADWADVVVWVPDLETEGAHHLIRVIPGCELSVKEPGLGGSDAGPDLQLLDVVEDPPDTAEPDTVEGGRWCVAGRYWVEVTFAERARLELFHTKLRIVG